MKAAVLPDPVLALINTSLPSSNSGIAVSWINVGSGHANCDIACGKSALSEETTAHFQKKNTMRDLRSQEFFMPLIYQ